MKALLWTALLLSASLPAAAQAQETVMILDLAADEQYAREASQLTERLRFEIGAVPGWQVLPMRGTLDQARIDHGCPDGFTPNTDCMRRVAQTAGVGHVVFGRVRPDSIREGQTEFVVTLSHYVTATGRFDGSAYRSVFMDGDEAEITARLQTIIADMNIRQEPLRSVSMQDARQQGDGTLFLGLGIGSYTVAAVWVVAMIATSVRIGDIEGDPAYATYRGRVPPGTTNVCDEAAAGNGWTHDEGQVRNLCNEAATLEILQFVFLGAAAAFTGLGTAFVLAAPGEQPAVTLTPSVGSDRAALTLRGQF